MFAWYWWLLIVVCGFLASFVLGMTIGKSIKIADEDEEFRRKLGS